MHSRRIHSHILTGGRDDWWVEVLWEEETGRRMSGYGDSSGFWSARLIVACCGQRMMCDWSDRKRSMHPETARKGFVTSVTHSRPVRMLRWLCTSVHECIVNVASQVLFCLVTHHVATISVKKTMMFTTMNESTGTETKQTCLRMITMKHYCSHDIMEVFTLLKNPSPVYVSHTLYSWSDQLSCAFARTSQM